MPVTPIFESVFSKIYGKPCWGVKQGHASFLTFEFGKPHIVIREPIVASKNASSKVRESLARRRVYSRGQWHLWIYCCDWEALFRGKRVRSSSTDAKIGQAADFLNGQKLVRFSILPRKLQCVFEFDLGGVLKTRPFDRESEQWLLYEPTKKVLILRADGLYTYNRSNVTDKEQKWQPIQVSDSSRKHA
jgi:hypothetical protein